MGVMCIIQGLPLCGKEGVQVREGDLFRRKQRQETLEIPLLPGSITGHMLRIQAVFVGYGDKEEIHSPIPAVFRHESQIRRGGSQIPVG